jgi:hypothetical protein
MRVRRRRRRILGAVLATVYLGAVVWLLSPLWRSADAATSTSVPVREARTNGSVGIAPLEAPKPLPASLPGSNPTPATTAEGSGEAFSEGETEATASAPEVSEAPASSAPSAESSTPSSSETIIGGEG